MQPVLRAVALMGATGSGKSALALPLAEAAEVPIVCCDSMQVYTGLDIGTAKATKREQARVPHHLIDCCELPDAFSAARWATQAADVIRVENEAGRVPLIVGGTGLYLRALTRGLADIPEVSPAVRQALEQRLQVSGIEAMHAELLTVDAATAGRLPDTDTQRIMRALSVYHSSGRPLSAWIGEAPPAPPTEIPVFVLDVPREVLRLRIAERFDAMLAAGWLDEVRALQALHLADTHPVVRAVGYRQLLAHVRGECPLDEAVRDGITATRHYAKRQVTWFAHQTGDAVRGDAGMLVPLLADAIRARLPGASRSL
ncbi:MAG: tRNA (adenosine(37)-N6)-dimethylallyltransferase MiaA [Zetaproteobacteria bacterium CG06_land_8_20_14_3_00_59_53]|nr:MAG: tRNA (adenosine(37)-N6)-dimethylallyltransferase MiaA [Zetaproteobacteria bacterium CG2_30_59_37]PIO89004.1 MAG: tRNA (adenosine(37)-N6)-dimethylallyltransferase MiaA [Zetaproteobacteria bacterium CG23_combo_of_CG06-09_8_20_14_all_59_86]PIQ64345.1 MAG: tRNA (adenosine(37)-N6)-dimethylallyltransferase MiaA [Zetaproteobacteria bacterium CG11_big_fil_rev_8_21_14_0_20_59_439]PIU70307.1 MAG: tRNA (adenosine(37)-N6)-dimethylallyltransferase MiaA [Zetaproteobacteria bacterium CG06_land_8_20_14_